MFSRPIAQEASGQRAVSLAERLPDLILHLRQQKEVKSKMGAIMQCVHYHPGVPDGLPGGRDPRGAIPRYVSCAGWAALICYWSEVLVFGASPGQSLSSVGCRGSHSVCSETTFFRLEPSRTCHKMVVNGLFIPAGTHQLPRKLQRCQIIGHLIGRSGLFALSGLSCPFWSMPAREISDHGNMLNVQALLLA